MVSLATEHREREWRGTLSAGAYVVLRNPAEHRDVDCDDVAEAAESVAAASLLMWILDSIESEVDRWRRRTSGHGPTGSWIDVTAPCQDCRHAF